MKNMRQVIKTNHNFVTGEHYEQRVLKPVQASHNRVTIQLCDASSGKVIEEAVTENAITPFLESSAYGSISNALNNSALNGDCAYPAFSSIVLSDSDIGELEDLYFIHGNVVGMCNRSSTDGAGKSKYRGTYNSVESYQKIEDNGYKHIHLVYDWPTSSGNGKIQNIYWMPVTISKYDGDSTSTNYYPRFVGTLQSFVGSYKRSDLTFDKRGNAYQVRDSKHYKVLNLLKAINGIETLRTEPDESFHNNHEINGCYYTFIYSYANSGNSNFSMTLTINKHDTTGTILDTWNEDLITSVPQLVELRNNSKLVASGSTTSSANAAGYCDDDGWVGIEVKYCARRYDSVFPTRNSQGELEPNTNDSATVYSMYNVLTKQWLRVPNPWDVWCTFTHCANYGVLKKIDNRYLCRGGYYVTIQADKADVRLEGYSRAWCSDIGQNNESSSYGYPTKFHASLPIATGVYSTDSILALRPISAQTRLAAPITKTTLNTMKIQYDFFFKIPLPYMPPEHVWDLYK